MGVSVLFEMVFSWLGAVKGHPTMFWESPKNRHNDMCVSFTHPPTHTHTPLHLHLHPHLHRHRHTHTQTNTHSRAHAPTNVRHVGMSPNRGTLKNCVPASVPSKPKGAPPNKRQANFIHCFPHAQFGCVFFVDPTPKRRRKHILVQLVLLVFPFNRQTRPGGPP